MKYTKVYTLLLISVFTACNGPIKKVASIAGQKWESLVQ